MSDAAPDGLRLATPEGRRVVVAMVLGSGVTFLNATVVNVALPSVAEDLDTDLAGLQWVTNGYLVTLASLILVGGSAGDVHGRRRMFLAGMALLCTGSLIGGVAPELWVVVAGRLLQGVGASLMVPASLAIVDASFHPDDKGAAIGAWASGSALSTAGGPLVGGALVEASDWRVVFFVSLPLAAAAAWMTWRHVPESRDPRARSLDLPGGGLAVIAVAGVTYTLVQAPTDGWTDGLVVGAGAAGLTAAAAFVAVEKVSADPMLPFRLFSNRQFTGANLYTLVVYLAISGAFFFVTIQLQTVVGWTATAAGAANLPTSAIMIVGSPIAGNFSARRGPRGPLVAGPLAIAAGLVVLSRVEAGASYLLDVLPGVVLMGLGLATMVAPLTASVLAAAADEDVGIASAVNNAVSRLGGLGATALLPAAAGISGAVAGDEFSRGYERALLLAGGLCVVGAGIAAATIDRCVRTHTHRPTSASSGCTQVSVPGSETAGDG